MTGCGINCKATLLRNQVYHSWQSRVSKLLCKIILQYSLVKRYCVVLSLVEQKRMYHESTMSAVEEAGNIGNLRQ